MKIIYIMFATFYSVASSFAFMVSVKQLPPYKWGEWPYAKNRLAIYINKVFEKTKYFKCRIDVFHFWIFILFDVLLFLSILITIIDYILDSAITNYFGNIGLIFILFVILFLPYLLEAILVTWWTIIDKNNPKVKKIRDFNYMKNKNRKK